METLRWWKERLRFYGFDSIPNLEHTNRKVQMSSFLGTGGGTHQGFEPGG
jgi:hypothetical protein